MDGNFQAEHMRIKNPDNDIPLSDRAGFMVSKKLYELHLKLAVERWQVALYLMFRDFLFWQPPPPRQKISPKECGS